MDTCLLFAPSNEYVSLFSFKNSYYQQSHWNLSWDVYKAMGWDVAETYQQTIQSKWLPAIRQVNRHLLMLMSKDISNSALAVDVQLSKTTQQKLKHAAQFINTGACSLEFLTPTKIKPEQIYHLLSNIAKALSPTKELTLAEKRVVYELRTEVLCTVAVNLHRMNLYRCEYMRGFEAKMLGRVLKGIEELLEAHSFTEENQDLPIALFNLVLDPLFKNSGASINKQLLVQFQAMEGVSTKACEWFRISRNLGLSAQEGVQYVHAQNLKETLLNRYQAPLSERYTPERRALLPAPAHASLIKLLSSGNITLGLQTALFAEHLPEKVRAYMQDSALRDWAYWVGLCANVLKEPADKKVFYELVNRWVKRELETGNEMYFLAFLHVLAQWLPQLKIADLGFEAPICFKNLNFSNKWVESNLPLVTLTYEVRNGTITIDPSSLYSSLQAGFDKLDAPLPLNLFEEVASIVSTNEDTQEQLQKWKEVLFGAMNPEQLRALRAEIEEKAQAQGSTSELLNLLDQLNMQRQRQASVLAVECETTPIKKSAKGSLRI